ncbi:hypothetical protein BHM03_00005559 [Ensete ventricosum]|nr:hypothetical protein BHM03_00005559 [Ensete ventricosum]
MRKGQKGFNFVGAVREPTVGGSAKVGVFVPTASHLIFSYAPTYHIYDMTAHLFLTSVSNLSYLCLSTFVHCYGFYRFLFLDKIFF